MVLGSLRLIDIRLGGEVLGFHNGAFCPFSSEISNQNKTNSKQAIKPNSNQPKNTFMEELGFS